MALSFGRVRRVGSQRHGDWSGSTPQTSVGSIAASSAGLLITFTPAAAGETLIRTRGLFGWKSDQNVAAEDQFGAVGLCRVSAQAEAIGITAVPHPDTDAGYPWLWHSYFASSFVFGTAVGMEPNFMHSMVIDSKAMRKVSDDERIVMVVENSTPFGISTYSALRLYSKAF